VFDRYRGRGDDEYGPPPPPFRLRQTSFNFGNFRGVNKWIILGVTLIIAFVVLDTVKGIYINWLWFDGAGYKDVYTKVIRTQVALFAVGGLVMAIFLGINVWWAARLALLTPARGIVDDAEATSLRRLFTVGLIAGVLFVSAIFGTIAASHWEQVLPYFNATSFGVNDPQFGKDVGFYVFELPALRLLFGWSFSAVVVTTLAVSGLYLFRYLVVGADVETGRYSRPHLCILLLFAVGLFIFHYYLARYELVFSTKGVVFGATYTDIHARLLFIYVGTALALLTAGALVFAAVTRRTSAPITTMILWAVVMLIGATAYPETVQRLQVQPNELEKEREYIQRNIDMTRRAFGLDAIEEKQFPAAPEVTAQEIADNQATIDNIRLLDVAPLRQTYAQIQTIRPLYEFLDVDVDRYTIDGQRRSVMLSARELSSGRLPPDAQGWVNRRLQFTHGYGAVMSPVNVVIQEGLPELWLRDIPITGKLQITRPEIYYGEEPEHYVVVNTKAKEFDYPVGDGSVQTVFEGKGGVQLGNIFNRFLLAWQFADTNILISGSLTNESRLLFHRNIAERVQTLAPFLRLDRDPYLVISDGRLFWIQDAYTATSHYPYSTPAPGGFNYIRNSVKVVIDAYDGTTNFYIADPKDPIIQTYGKIFPKLFQPLDKMPATLREHLRYPEDLFLAQVSQYRTYHIKDPGQLYNKEDLWQIPNELGPSGGEQPLAPYYIIMRLPGETTEQFVEILPLTPARRANTIAWMAARSDVADYGKLTVFRFPTDTVVFGPRQVEARIDQDTAISAQFSLWNQSGSRVTRGNLLMIPVGRGNLYIEPVYLQAESSQLPELKRVVVVNGGRISMEPTLSQALDVVFGRAPSTLPTSGSPATSGPGVTPTPGPGGTPGASPTPRPAATPAPAGTPGAGVSVNELARQADAAYQRAQTALRNGDFATYGTEIATVQSLIQQIVQRSTP
jgi:uncharacterized membrane protein (UPF0182 family)